MKCNVNASTLSKATRSFFFFDIPICVSFSHPHLSSLSYSYSLLSCWPRYPLPLVTHVLCQSKFQLSHRVPSFTLLGTCVFSHPFSSFPAFCFSALFHYPFCVMGGSQSPHPAWICCANPPCVFPQHHHSASTPFIFTFIFPHYHGVIPASAEHVCFLWPTPTAYFIALTSVTSTTQHLTTFYSAFTRRPY